MKTLFGIFMIGILVINFTGYVVLEKKFSTLVKGQERLVAGQEQIAGFMMVPGSEQTGPIRVFYDAGKDEEVDIMKYRKGMPKVKDRKGTK